MLTRLAHGALRSPEALEKLEQEVQARIDQEVGKGGVEWLANYAVLGPYDYLDQCGARPSGDSSRRWSEIFLQRRDEGGTLGRKPPPC